MVKTKKAQVTMYIYFIFLAIIIILIGAVAAPLGIMFNTEMYLAGEKILDNTQEDINAIQDTEVKDSINNVVASAKADTTTNIEVLSSIFQYSWVIVLILTVLVMFLQTRRLIETGAGGFI